MESTLSKWGHNHNSDQISAYEINNTHAKATIKNTDCIIYYQYFSYYKYLPRVEAILYSNMEMRLLIFHTAERPILYYQNG